MYETQDELDAFFEPLFQFRPVRKLGEGAFGLAVLVYDEVEEVHKVFKLPKTQETTDALQREGANMRKLSELLHPNIIRLHQYGRIRMNWQGKEEERYYLNMAYGGKSLRARLGKISTEFDEHNNPIVRGSRIRLPIPEALTIAIDVAQGLEAAHGFKGAPFRMIHRDIKPDNILIDEETGTARLTDFGISRIVDRTTAVASFGGTLLYMDPECFLGRATLQSDIYSLGIVLHEMVTGELPFANFEARMQGKAISTAELVPDTPAELAEAVLRALEPNVEARYENVSEFLADLRRVHARLNPLPDRYQELSRLPGGQLLCDDRETGSRVTIRLLHTVASLREMAQGDTKLEGISDSSLLPAERQFRNEQYLGIVHPVRSVSSLFDKYSNSDLSQPEQMESFCSLIVRLCDLLGKLHDNQIEHGFLSPYCIFETSDGDAQLAEIGMTPVLRSRHFCGHSEDSLFGWQEVLPFCSPQMLDASTLPTPVDDVYSLGAILFFMLTGEPAISNEERHHVIHREGGAEPAGNPRSINPMIPESLASIVVKSIQWNPLDRYQSIGEMADALRGVKFPDDIAETLLSEALDVYQEGDGSGDLLKSCRLIDRVLEICPGNIAAHEARGVVYFRNRSFEHAAEEFQKVVRVRPDAESFHYLGQCFESLPDQLGTARDYFRRALAYGEDAEILARYANALFRTGAKTDAFVAMKRSIDLENDESVKQRRILKLQSWQEDADAAAELHATVFEDVPETECEEVGEPTDPTDGLTEEPGAKPSDEPESSEPDPTEPMAD